MHLRLFLILTCVFLQIERSESVNILFYHLLSSYSHRICVWPLVEELSARGHNVTFLQSYPPKTPNPAVTEFYPKALGHIWGHIDESLTSNGNSFVEMRVNGGPWSVRLTSPGFSYVGLKLCDLLLSESEMDEFVKSSKFDLVIVDSLYNECAYGLAYKWGAKTILYSSSAPSGIWAVESHGFLGSAEPWISDQVIFPTQMPLTFIDRVKNMVLIVIIHLIKEWYYYPQLGKLFESKLNISNLPPLRNLLEDTALVLYNSHFSEEEARTFPPKFISVPALHAWDISPEPLPRELLSFIEEGGDAGFIYVSFGGEANFDLAPIEFQNIFMQVFAQLPVRFIWKRSPPKIDTNKLPSNIFMQSWLPQMDILASPKCKGFITHGGLLGIQEGILNGVPMIVMPVFAEQEYNAFRIERTGRGIKLEAYGLTETSLKDAIEEILRNNSYKEEVEKTRTQLRDQQNRPLDTAVFWTEYVLRHDMSTLQPLKLRHFYWFQSYFLDVWAFLALITLALPAVLFYILRNIYARYSLKISTTKLKTK